MESTCGVFTGSPVERFNLAQSSLCMAMQECNEFLTILNEPEDICTFDTEQRGKKEEGSFFFPPRHQQSAN